MLSVIYCINCVARGVNLGGEGSRKGGGTKGVDLGGGEGGTRGVNLGGRGGR